MSLYCSLCPTGSQKPEDSSFTIINDGEKQQILKFEKPEPAKV